MESSRIYQIVRTPRYSHTAVTEGLIAAVPRTWGWIEGKLDASAFMLASGHTLNNTGFMFSQHCNGDNLLVTPDWVTSVEEVRPDLLGHVLKHKAPRFVIFRDSGMAGRAQGSFDRALTLAQHYVHKHYVGRLRIFRDLKNRNYHDNTARLELYVGSWHAGSRQMQGREWGQQPAQLRLYWNEQLGGRETHLAPLIECAERLELPLYEPQRAQEQAS